MVSECDSHNCTCGESTGYIDMLLTEVCYLLVGGEGGGEGSEEEGEGREGVREEEGERGIRRSEENKVHMIMVSTVSDG